MEIIDYNITVRDTVKWEEDCTLETVYSFIEFWENCDDKNFEKNESEWMTNHINSPPKLLGSEKTIDKIVDLEASSCLTYGYIFHNPNDEKQYKIIKLSKEEKKEGVKFKYGTSISQIRFIPILAKIQNR